MARRRPSKTATLFHFFFGLMTGGIWWVLLLIHYLRK